MEERIIDRENERKIRVKRTADGNIERVEDELVPEQDESEEPIAEEEITVDFPEEETEEYDENLVGLTPSQLQKELERREKIRQEAYAERDKLLASAEMWIEKGEYAQAEQLCGDALVYDGESVAAAQKLWLARTKNFQDDEPLYLEKYAQQLSESKEEVRAYVLARVSERLRRAREEDVAEEAPLAEKFGSEQEKRRAAFGENRKYYLFRLVAVAAVFVLMGIGAAVSANFIVRTTTSVPLFFTVGFGALALVFLGVTFFFLRKWLVADRLCRENERLASTEDGARLETLRRRIRCATLILEGTEEGAAEAVSDRFE